MQLNRRQKEEIFQNGYVKIARLIPHKLINVALRAINHSLGRGMNKEDIEQFRADSFCPELRNEPSITDLLHASPLFSLAESATKPGAIRFSGGAQIALRFPVMEYPGNLHPHLDGMYRPKNRVGKGMIESFTMLAGVFLSDMPNRFWGNFSVWPGTHRLFEEYFRQRGVKSLVRGMPKVSMPEPVQILAEAGDAILCHYQLAHTVVINVSPYVRYAVFFRLSHKDHIKHGDKIFTDIWLEWPGIGERGIPQ